MANVKNYRTTFREDCGMTALARVRNPAGTYITQASLTAITCKVYDQDGALVVTPTVTISSAVFDTLQVPSASDTRWATDLTGYNFRFEVPATAFAAPTTGSGLQTVEFLFDPVSGENFAIVYQGPVLGLFQS